MGNGRLSYADRAKFRFTLNQNRNLKQTRTHYSAEEKVTLLRRHLEQGEAVSKRCEDQGLRPTVFYRWKKEFFEGGAASG